ncbi:MAG TPA: hypothetical protein VFB66_25115 [Tepidisphaeraceae bacterium]|nr:hypothetical protein [Tepidisphaeraceae bacterium]
MSRDARKKQKHELKRKHKQIEARKAASLTPLDRIARSGGKLECYVNADWQKSGMASVQVLGHAPDGRLAHAAFLVDLWCVGLKDAYGHRTVLRGEFEDQLDRMSEGLEIVRIPPEQARRLVAGAIRFSRQNGFHLPPHYDRWTGIFTDLGDLAAADLSDFGVDGGLRYVGTEEFLRRRLAACTPDQFLSRPDVHWVMHDGTPRSLGADDVEGDDDFVDEADLDDELADEELLPDEELLAGLREMVGGTGSRIEEAVRTWCARTGQTPHPRLHEAVATLLVTTLPMAFALGAGEEDVADVPDVPNLMDVPHPDDLLDVALDGVPDDDRRSIQEAMDQVSEYMGQFKSPRDMLAAVHSLPPPEAGGPQLPAP